MGFDWNFLNRVGGINRYANSGLNSLVQSSYSNTSLSKIRDIASRRKAEEEKAALAKQQPLDSVMQYAADYERNAIANPVTEFDSPIYKSSGQSSLQLMRNFVNRYPSEGLLKPTNTINLYNPKAASGSTFSYAVEKLKSGYLDMVIGATKFGKNMADLTYGKNNTTTAFFSDIERQRSEAQQADLNVKGAKSLVGKVASGLGTSLFSMTFAPIAIPAIFMSSMGEGIDEARIGGGDDRQSIMYGLLKGVIEGGAESIFSGIPYVKGIVPKGFQKTLAKLTKSTLLQKVISKAPLSALGEGVEEVLSITLTPYAQRATFNENAKNPTLGEVAEAFALGVVVSGILNMPASVSNLYNSRTGTKAKAPIINDAVNSMTEAEKAKYKSAQMPNRNSAEFVKQGEADVRDMVAKRMEAVNDTGKVFSPAPRKQQTYRFTNDATDASADVKNISIADFVSSLPNDVETLVDVISQVRAKEMALRKVNTPEAKRELMKINLQLFAAEKKLEEIGGKVSDTAKVEEVKQSQAKNQSKKENKYYVNYRKGNDIGFQEVEGKPVIIEGAEDLDLFVHKSTDPQYKGWIVSSGLDGRKLTIVDSSQKQAVETAKKILKAEVEKNPNIIAELVAAIEKNKRYSPRHNNKNVAVKAEPATVAKKEIITDPSRVQEIKNSIREGEMILKSGKTVSGKKMSAEEINMVKKSIDSAKAKITPVAESTSAPAQPKATAKVEEVKSDMQIDEKNLAKVTQKAVENEAFEKAMSKMGYKTLDELSKEGTKPAKPLNMKNVLSHEVLGNQRLQFEEVKKYYEKQLYKNKEFVNKIKNDYVDGLKKTARATKVEESFSKQDWEVPKDIILERGSRYVNGKDVLVTHKESIQKALAEGKPVPQEVLNDYPELAPAQPKTTQPPKPPTKADASDINLGRKVAKQIRTKTESEKQSIERKAYDNQRSLLNKLYKQKVALDNVVDRLMTKADEKSKAQVAQFEKRVAKLNERIANEKHKLREFKYSEKFKDATQKRDFQIKSLLSKITKQVADPVKDSYMNEEFKKTVAELVSDLMPDPTLPPKKSKVATVNLKEKLQSIIDDTPDSRFSQDVIDSIDTLKGKTYAEMNNEQKQALLNLLRHIYVMNKTYNQFISLNKRMTLKDGVEQAHKSISRQNNVSGNSFFQMLRNLTMWRTVGGADKLRWLAGLTEFTDSAKKQRHILYELAKRWNKSDTVNVEIKKFFHDEYKESVAPYAASLLKYFGAKAEKVNVEFDGIYDRASTKFNKNNLDVSIDNLTDMWLAWRDGQNKGHMELGGYVVEYRDSNGKRDSQKDVTVRVSAEDMKRIDKILPDDVKEIAKAISGIYNGSMRKATKAIMIKVNGFASMFRQNYYPIKAQSTTNKGQSIDTQNVLPANLIGSMGITKAVKPRAGNPIVGMSTLARFAQHTENTAHLVAYAEWVADIVPLINSTFVSGSIRQDIEKAYGKDGLESMLAEIRRIAGFSANPDTANKFWNTLLNLSKKSMIIGNPSSWLKQPISYLRATSVIPTKHLVYGITHPEFNWKELDEISPAFRFRRSGGSQPEVDMLSRFDLSKAEQKIDPFFFGLRTTDSFTAGAIYSATKNFVKEDIKKGKLKLKEGSAEYKAEVVNRFDEALMESQLTGFSSTAGEVFLNRDFVNRANPLLMFKSEMYKGFNNARKYLGEAQASKNPKAWRKFYKTVAAIMVGNFIEKSISLAFKYIRDPDEEKKKWRDEPDKELAKFVVSSLVGILPVADIIADMLMYARPFTRPETTYISKVGATVLDLGKIITKQTSDDVEAQTKPRYTITGWGFRMAQDILNVAGLPVEKLISDIVMPTGRAVDPYGYAVALSIMFDMENPSNREPLYNMLYDARKSKNEDLSSKIITLLKKHNATTEQINNALKRRIKAEKEANK